MRAVYPSVALYSGRPGQVEDRLTGTAGAGAERKEGEDKENGCRGRKAAPVGSTKPIAATSDQREISRFGNIARQKQEESVRSKKLTTNFRCKKI